MWSIDASVPLFGVKFTVLFTVCLLLFLLLLPFNMTLLFTRYLLQVRIINQFKLLLDAFQAPYKDQYYYWTGVNLTLRSVFFSFNAFQIKKKLLFSIIALITFSIFVGYTQPNKNKLVNIQEL